jgi:predicted transcriptional regulator
MIEVRIRNNADKILKYLKQSNEASINKIRDQCQLQEQEICLALGWMACENKIFFLEGAEELTAVICPFEKIKT